MQFLAVYVCMYVREFCMHVFRYVCTYARTNIYMYRMHACMYVSACAMLCHVMYVRVSYDMLCFVMLSMHTCVDEMYVCE